MTRRLRILHLRASNFVGGPEHQLLRYAEFERDGPFEVILGTFVGAHEGGEYLEAIKRRGLPYLALPAGTMGDARALWALLRFLRKHEIAALCTHGYRADVLGMLAGLFRRVPVACFLRGWTREDWKVRIYEALDRALLPLAGRVVCLSQTQAGRLARRRYLREKIRVVVNVVDPTVVAQETRSRIRTELRQRLGLADDACIVAAAGRLSPEKGACYFLHAVPAIRSQSPDARFVVFGEGPLRGQLERLTDDLGIRAEVRLAGHLPNFRQWLPGIDVLVNPSLSEVMPNVILEAMAAGVPVVATDVGGVAEIAGDNALVLVPPSDSAAIAQAVTALLLDHAGSRELGLVGQRRVEQAFSPAHQKVQLRALYQDLIPELAVGRTMLSPQPANTSKISWESSADSTAITPLPFISIVLPVRNEQAHLGALLEDLLAQEYPPHRYEILVVDGDSTDRTAESARSYSRAAASRVRVLPNPRRLSSAGRNVGVLASRGELILFIDGHCRIPSPTLLLDTARAMRATDAECLCRPQPLTTPGNTWFQEVVAHTRATPLGHGTDSTIYATCLEGFVNPTSSGAAYHRSVFSRVGMYDERFDACEDVEFNHRVSRAGLRSYFSSRLSVYYRPRSTLRGLFKQLIRYGRGRFRLIRKHPDALNISQLIPPAFLLWLVAGGLASLASTIDRKTFLASLIVYLGLILSFSAWLAIRHGWRHLFVSPAIYLAIHLGLGAGFWAEAGKSLWEQVCANKRDSSSDLVLQGANPVLHPKARNNATEQGKSDVRAGAVEGK